MLPPSRGNSFSQILVGSNFYPAFEGMDKIGTTSIPCQVALTFCHWSKERGIRLAGRQCPAAKTVASAAVTQRLCLRPGVGAGQDRCSSAAAAFLPACSPNLEHHHRRKGSSIGEKAAAQPPFFRVEDPGLRGHASPGRARTCPRIADYPHWSRGRPDPPIEKGRYLPA